MRHRKIWVIAALAGLPVAALGQWLNHPKTFTSPVTIKFNEHLLTDTDLIESYCSENEKDLVHTELK